MDPHDEGQSDRARRNRKRSAKADRYKRDNSGGFGNPPVKGQFKRGNKLGGRKKGVTSLETEIRKLLGKKVAIKTEGERRFMLPQEIVAQRILSAILSEKSSPATIDHALKLFDEFGPKEVETIPRLMDFARLTRDERGILAALLGRVVKESAQAPVEASTQPNLDRVVGMYQVRRGDDGHIVIDRIISNP